MNTKIDITEITIDKTESELFNTKCKNIYYILVVKLQIIKRE